MKVWVVKDDFTGYYAGSSHGEWFSHHEDGVHHTDRKRADASARRIMKGPRQFGGVGSKVTVVEVKLGPAQATPNQEDPKG